MEYFDLGPGESITFGDDDAIRLLVLKSHVVAQKTFLGVISKFTKEECPILLSQRVDQTKIFCPECDAKFDYFRLFCNCGANLSSFMGHPWNEGDVTAELPFDKIEKELEAKHINKILRIDGYWIRLKNDHRIFGRDKKCLHCESKITKCLLYRRAIDSNKFRVLFTDENYVPFTIDHIHPKSKGGPSTFRNYQTLCWNCNNIKGDTIPADGLQT